MTSSKSQGKSFILATAGVAILAWTGITFLPTDSATAAKGAGGGKPSGTLACAGFYTSNNNQKLRWIFVNNNAAPINIDGFRIYDWDGAKVWDSNDPLYGGTLPTDLNGLIGDTDKTLDGYQTAWYKSEQLLTAGVLPPHTTQNNNHIKLHVDWHADISVAPLAGTTVRHLHLGDGTPWGRSISECRDI